MRHLPNIITVLRGIVITPALALAFIYAFLEFCERVPPAAEYLPSWLTIPLIGLALTIIGAVSDGVDGYLAKNFNWKSDWGAKYDPLMDKWFTYTGFLVVPLHYGGGHYLLAFLFFGTLIHLYSKQTTEWRKQGKILHANESARKKSGVLFVVQLVLMIGIYVGGDAWYVTFPLAFVGTCYALTLCALAYDEYSTDISDAERRIELELKALLEHKVDEPLYQTVAFLPKTRDPAWPENVIPLRRVA